MSMGKHHIICFGFLCFLIGVSVGGLAQKSQDDKRLASVVAILDDDWTQRDSVYVVKCYNDYMGVIPTTVYKQDSRTTIVRFDSFQGTGHCTVLSQRLR